MSAKTYMINNNIILSDLDKKKLYEIIWKYYTKFAFIWPALVIKDTPLGDSVSFDVNFNKMTLFEYEFDEMFKYLKLSSFQ